MKLKLEPTFQKHKTYMDLQLEILKISNHYQSGKIIRLTEFTTAFGLQDAINDQNNNLRWYHFMLG